MVEDPFIKHFPEILDHLPEELIFVPHGPSIYGYGASSVIRISIREGLSYKALPFAYRVAQMNFATGKFESFWEAAHQEFEPALKKILEDCVKSFQKSRSERVAGEKDKIRKALKDLGRL